MIKGAKRVVVMLAVTMSIFMATGCTTSAELRKLSIGMDKQQVIAILGRPLSTRTSTKTTGTVDIWNYTFAKNVLGIPPGRDTYLVFFKNHKVFQWGEEHDLGNPAKDPDYIEKRVIQNQAEKKEPRF